MGLVLLFLKKEKKFRLQKENKKNSKNFAFFSLQENWFRDARFLSLKSGNFVMNSEMQHSLKFVRDHDI